MLDDQLSRDELFALAEIVGPWRYKEQDEITASVACDEEFELSLSINKIGT